MKFGLFASLVLVLAGATRTPAANLPTAFPDSSLRAIPVGEKTTKSTLNRLGFEPAAIEGPEAGSNSPASLHFERSTPDRADFLEVTPGSWIVRASGWHCVVSAARANELLGEFVRDFGFPDDVVAEDSVHGVAWADPSARLRFEIVLAPSESEAGAMDLSAVLRRTE